MSAESDAIRHQTKQNNANHYKLIGWLITSFFLIFLGGVFPVFIKWVNNPNSIDKIIVFGTIGLTMFFGYIVARLFLRSQWRKLKCYGKGKENDLYKHTSVKIYIAFIILIEIFLFYILIKLTLYS